MPKAGSSRPFARCTISGDLQSDDSANGGENGKRRTRWDRAATRRESTQAVQSVFWLFCLAGRRLSNIFAAGDRATREIARLYRQSPDIRTRTTRNNPGTAFRRTKILGAWH